MSSAGMCHLCQAPVGSRDGFLRQEITLDRVVDKRGTTGWHGTNRIFAKRDIVQSYCR